MRLSRTVFRVSTRDYQCYGNSDGELYHVCAQVYSPAYITSLYLNYSFPVLASMFWNKFFPTTFPHTTSIQFSNWYFEKLTAGGVRKSSSNGYPARAHSEVFFSSEPPAYTKGSKKAFWQSSLAMNTSDNPLLSPTFVWVDNKVPAFLGRFRKWRDQQGRMAGSSYSVPWGNELWSQTNCHVPGKLETDARSTQPQTLGGLYNVKGRLSNVP